MKKRKKRQSLNLIKAMAVVIVIVVATGSFSITDVMAGSSDVIVDNSSFANELDTSKWNAPNADVIVKNGKIVFGADSNGNTRLITKRAAKTCAQFDTLVDVTCILNISKIPNGQKFIMAFGLASTESYYGEAGNFELVFENKKELVAGIRYYDESGMETSLVKAQSIGKGFDQPFEIKVNVTRDRKVKIVVNKKMLYNGKSLVDLEGRVGFLQTGSCQAEISSVNILSHEYDTPENVNIVEDFESGSMNINTLTSKMLNSCLYYPAGVAVERYDDGHVLMWRNANLAYFGTLYKYSNFEVTFDVPYMLHSNIVRENGTVKTPAHLKFVVAFGDEAKDYDDYGYATSAEGIAFGSTDISSLKENFEPVYFNGSDFYEKDLNEGYSVRVTMVDTIVTVEIKALDATKYTELISYKIGNATPQGYIHIWSTGQANFAIDNFCVRNLDYNAKIVEVDYQKKVLENIEDWVYEPTEAQYLQTEVKDERLISPMLLVYVAGVGIVIVLFSLLVAKMHKTPKKEGKTDET